MIDQDLDKARRSLVVQSNEFIQQGRNNLSLQEYRMILYIISKIDINDTYFKEVRFSLNDFCDICGINRRDNLTILKSAVMSLRNKGWWMKLDDRTMTTVGWFNKATIFKDSDECVVELDRTLAPYLLNLRENFTPYEFRFILSLKSKYSMIFYQLFKSYEYQRQCRFYIDDLREVLGIDKKKYSITADFKRYVVEPAIDEINTFNDIQIAYTDIKQSRRIIGFQFDIKPGDKDNARYMTDAFLGGQIPSSRQQTKAYQEYRKQENK